MGIGLGILLLVIGLILLFAVKEFPDSLQEVVDPSTVGWILVIAGALALVLGLVMSLWRPMTYSDAMVPDQLSVEMWLRTGLAILVFLVIAGGWAVVGARRGLPAISASATVGVVVFTTFQSFAVFAPIISGATLFIAVGVVMLITGVVAERARRIDDGAGNELDHTAFVANLTTMCAAVLG